MARYKTLTEDPNAELFWVSQLEILPDVCACCGLFTADRVNVKTVVKAEKKASWASGIFHVLVATFGGPLGWIFAITSASTDENGKSTIKVKIKMPQCILCKVETKLEIVESNYEKKLYRLFVNPTFADRYRLVNAEEA